MAEENPLPGEPEDKDLQGRISASDSGTDSASNPARNPAPRAFDAAEDSPRPRNPADPLSRLFASAQEPAPTRWESTAREPLPDTTAWAMPDAAFRTEQSVPPETHDTDAVDQTPVADFTPAPILPERLSHTREMAALSMPPSPLPQPVADQSTPVSAARVTAPDLQEERTQPVRVTLPVADIPARAAGIPGNVATAASTTAPGAPEATLPRAPAATAPASAPSSETTASPRQVISLATISGAQQPVQVPMSASSSANSTGNSDIIRCRQCGKSAPSELTLCPHCGRELKAAPSRWLTIGAPAIVGVLLLALLALQMGNGPLGIVTTPMRALSGWIAELSANLDPQMTVLPAVNFPGSVALSEDFGAVGIPPTEDAAEAGDASFADVSGASLIGAGEGSTTEQGEATPGDAASSVAPDASATVVESAAEPIEAENSGAETSGATAENNAPVTVTLPTETPAPTATPVETPTDAPTNTPEPTPTLLPTDTPAPTNTALPATYTVVSGDTALGIAARLGIDLQALIAYNNMSSAQASMLQPGQVLQIPGGVVTPNSEAGETTYTVRDGDTLVVIAQRNGVTVAQLMTTNGLSQSDVLTLRPGQTLVIPGPTPAPSPAPTETPAPTASATAAPTVAATSAPAATSTTAANTASLRVTAPRLRAPISGVSLNCSVEGRLQWNASPNIEPADNYRVHLGFVSGRDDAGNLRITWLVEQAVPSTQTSLALDSSLCGTAPDDFGGQWRWYVDVVTDINGTKAPVSTPSEIWGFAWQ